MKAYDNCKPDTVDVEQKRCGSAREDRKVATCAATRLRSMIEVCAGQEPVLMQGMHDQAARNEAL